MIFLSRDTKTSIYPETLRLQFIFEEQHHSTCISLSISLTSCLGSANCQNVVYFIQEYGLQYYLRDPKNRREKRRKFVKICIESKEKHSLLLKSVVCQSINRIEGRKWSVQEKERGSKRQFNEMGFLLIHGNMRGEGKMPQKEDEKGKKRRATHFVSVS